MFPSLLFRFNPQAVEREKEKRNRKSEGGRGGKERGRGGERIFLPILLTTYSHRRWGKKKKNSRPPQKEKGKERGIRVGSCSSSSYRPGKRKTRAAREEKKEKKRDQRGSCHRPVAKKKKKGAEGEETNRRRKRKREKGRRKDFAGGLPYEEWGGGQSLKPEKEGEGGERNAFPTSQSLAL